jgi:hypothetical protein
MADIGPALVTGGAAVVGVLSGAGLTYWFGALNRRHQEAREDKTRWYEARRQAYVQLGFELRQDAVVDPVWVLAQNCQPSRGDPCHSPSWPSRGIYLRRSHPKFCRRIGIRNKA